MFKHEGNFMSDSKLRILVFGATGQQGGSVASALLKAGWQVRAFVRDPASSKSVALRDAGVELMQGAFADVESVRRAMNGVNGIFSVQPSSGQGPTLGLTDEEEERYGIAIADLAVESGIKHLVYTSTGAVGAGPTGMGHFDSKARIEDHIRTLPITASIVRPAAFMEMLVMPGFGLDEGRFNFFARPDQQMQLLAVEDIGKFVAAIFADPVRFGGKTLEIASDTVTGRDLEALFTEAAGRPIAYSRFSDEVLAANPFLRKLTGLLDEGRLAGKADLDALRELNPDLQSFRSWLAGSGRKAFREALGKAGAWDYGHA
ncbi:NmrA/HSCARG family protein [Mesorhizobium sp. M0938]|uniref:NmrA/HSCARG family protein n=1 Tax=unclassified Mesorhizobium TaxID=325217 RepID=UPI003335F38B